MEDHRHDGNKGTNGIWTILLTLAFLAAVVAIFSPDESSGQTYADLFARDPQPIDLKTDGLDSVVGRLGGVLAPGSSVNGGVDLSATDLSHLPLDLDIDLDYRIFSAPGTGHTPALKAQFPRELYITELRYGALDLLDGPERRLLLEIDQHPLLGNADGRLSVYEFQAGANDLPPPGSPRAPTPLRLSLTVDEDITPEWIGLSIDVRLRFFLSDTEEEDLNY